MPWVASRGRNAIAHACNTAQHTDQHARARARRAQVEAKYDSLQSEHNAMLVDAKKQQQDFIRR